LQNNYTKLYSDYRELLDSFNKLKNDYNNLQKQFTDAIQKLENLNKSYYQLKSSYLSLQSNYTKLLNNYQRIEAEYSNLNNSYQQLRTSYANLQNSYNKLYGDYQTLLDIINLKYSTVLERGRAVAIPANSYYTLSYSTSYAGYIRICFSATASVNIWVGSSLTSNFPWGNYYTYYSGTSKCFTAPVLPGATYIRIENPSWFYGVTVTIDIIYYY